MAVVATGRWAGRWSVLAAAVVVLAVSWVAALAGSVGSAEEWVFRVFNDLPDWLEGPSWPVMQLGSLAVVPVAALAAYGAWRRWAPAVSLLSAGLAAWLLAKVVKDLVERGRPDAYLGDVNLRPAWEGLGFVSGHAAIAFALATVVTPRLGVVGRTLVWAGAVATAMLRMYTAAHLPLDVVGGAALGVATGVTVLLVGDAVVGADRSA